MSQDQIFISYSSPDKDWVKEFAKSLRSRGLMVWLDQDQIRAGDSINEAIERGLRESSYVLFVLTPETINRPNLLFEMGAALGMRKAIVPVVSRDLDVSALPQPLRSRRYLVRDSPEETAEQFVLETAARS